MNRRALLSALAVTLFVLSLALPAWTGRGNAAAQTPGQTLTVLSQIGGATYAVHVLEPYAYIGVGPRLHILDLSTPQPTLVGMSAPFPDLLRDVQALDCGAGCRRAIIAAGNAGLRIVDVSTAGQPSELGAFACHADALAVVGARVYLADRYAGLRILNISDPLHPQEETIIPVTGQARDVAIAGGYAYVAAGSGGLRVLSISGTPKEEIGSADVAGIASGIAVNGRYVYLAAGSAGLLIFDLADPTQPVEIGALASPGEDYDVLAPPGQSRVYVAGDSGLRVVDVQDPETPVELGAWESAGEMYRLAWDAADSGRLYLGGATGLHILDASDASAPTPIGHYASLGESRAAALDGKYAYIAAGASGLRVLDIQNPADPIEVGGCALPGSAAALALSGGRAYVAARWGGLRIVDTTNPLAPAEVGFASLPGSTLGVAVQGHLAFVAAATSGLRILDVSDPALPVELGQFAVEGLAQSVTVAGRYAYLTEAPILAASGRVHILDIANPAQPLRVGLYDTPGAPSSLALPSALPGCRFAYVAEAPLWGQDAGLRVLDISQPGSPIVAGFHELGGSPESVALFGRSGQCPEFAAVASGAEGLRILSVANASGINEAAAFQAPGSSMHVAVQESAGQTDLFASQRDGGLVILRFVAAAPTLTPTPSNTPRFTATPTWTPTETSIWTLTPTTTYVPTDTPEPTGTATPAPSATPIPTTTATDMPIPTATTTWTPVPTATPTSATPTIWTPTVTPGIALSLRPSFVRMPVGELCHVEIVLDLGAQRADGLQAYLDFEPSLLAIVDAAGNPVTQITPEEGFRHIFGNHVDAQAGTIDYVVGANVPAGGQVIVASFYVKGLAPTAGAFMRFHRAFPRWTMASIQNDPLPIGQYQEALFVLFGPPTPSPTRPTHYFPLMFKNRRPSAPLYFPLVTHLTRPTAMVRFPLIIQSRR